MSICSRRSDDSKKERKKSDLIVPCPKPFDRPCRSNEPLPPTVKIVQFPKIPASLGGPGPSAPPNLTPRQKRNLERLEILSRPQSRYLRALWDEKYVVLPKERRDKIKSALEEDYFLTPEQTELYFQNLNEKSRTWSGPGAEVSRRDQCERNKELKQREKWLVNFSSHVAYNLCDFITKDQKELLVSNRLRSIADVVLERVAELLGEKKPCRTHSGRLARFMVAISDRIAVWIENAVYRAEADEVHESRRDVHVPLDRKGQAMEECDRNDQWYKNPKKNDPKMPPKESTTTIIDTKRNISYKTYN